MFLARSVFDSNDLILKVLFFCLIYDNHQLWNKAMKYVISRYYHYHDIIMGTMASQITSPTIVYSTVYSGTDQRKHQSSASLAFVREIHRWPVNSPHKEPVTRIMFPFHDVIMTSFPQIKFHNGYTGMIRNPGITVIGIRLDKCLSQLHKTLGTYTDWLLQMSRHGTRGCV